jgi:hypothetical protein
MHYGQSDGRFIAAIGDQVQRKMREERKTPGTTTCVCHGVLPCDRAPLHYVLDLWFETEVKPRLRGKATLSRYGDDFLIGFEREDDARRVLAVLGKR